MPETILICRSLTYAQRTQSVLRAEGLRASLHRVSASQSGDGCGYGVRIRSRDLPRALAVLERHRLPPKGVLEEGSLP